MAKNKSGMPEQITLIHKEKGSKHPMPFQQALDVLKEQHGKHVSKKPFKIEEGFEFDGVDIIRVKEA